MARRRSRRDRRAGASRRWTARWISSEHSDRRIRHSRSPSSRNARSSTRARSCGSRNRCFGTITCSASTMGPTASDPPLDAGCALPAQPARGRHPLPLMHQLAEQTGESVSVYSRNDDVRVCIHRVDSKHAVRDHVREGDVLPLDRGSGGRILLAFERHQGRTVRDDPEGVLLRVGRRTRRRDRAASRGRSSARGQVLLGALTLAGPRSRMDATFIANARALLLRAAARATNSLGGDASEIEAALALTLAGKREVTRIAESAAREPKPGNWCAPSSRGKRSGRSSRCSRRQDVVRRRHLDVHDGRKHAVPRGHPPEYLRACRRRLAVDPWFDRSRAQHGLRCIRQRA